MYTLGVPDEEGRKDLNLLMAGVAAEKDAVRAASLGAELRCGGGVLLNSQIKAESEFESVLRS